MTWRITDEDEEHERFFAKGSDSVFSWRSKTESFDDWHQRMARTAPDVEAAVRKYCDQVFYLLECPEEMTVLVHDGTSVQRFEVHVEMNPGFVVREADE